MAAEGIIIITLLMTTLITTFILILFLMLARGTPLAIITAKLKKKSLLLYMDSRHFITVTHANYILGTLRANGVAGRWFVDPNKIFKLDGAIPTVMVTDTVSFNIDPKQTLSIQKLMEKFNAPTISDLFRQLIKKKLLVMNPINEAKAIVDPTTGKKNIVELPARYFDINDPNGELNVQLRIETVDAGKFLTVLQNMPHTTALHVDSIIAREVARRLQGKAISLKPLITIGIFFMIIAIAFWILGSAPTPLESGGGGLNLPNIPLPGLNRGG